MTREECEILILQKLKKIRALAKEYDDSNKGALNMVISNEKDYISVFNSSSVEGRLNTTIDFTLMNGEVFHYDN